MDGGGFGGGWDRQCEYRNGIWPFVVCGLIVKFDWPRWFWLIDWLNGQMNGFWIWDFEISLRRPFLFSVLHWIFMSFFLPPFDWFVCTWGPQRSIFSYSFVKLHACMCGLLTCTAWFLCLCGDFMCVTLSLSVCLCKCEFDALTWWVKNQ